jgi:hypothetical protein
MRFTIPPALAALLAAGALAQRPVPAPLAPGPTLAPNLPQPSPTTQARSGVVAVPVQQPPVVVNTAAFAPSFGFYPFSPFGGYLSGRADLVNAQANAALTYQQARLASLDYFNAALDTRRAVFNEAAFERGQTMNSEQVRQQRQIDAVRRARNDPPLNEIWSAVALNALFDNINRAHVLGLRGPDVPVDPEVLRHINTTTGGTNRSIGMLKNGPKLTWPPVFQDARFEAARTLMDERTAKALEQAMKGPVDQALIGEAREAIATMRVTLRQMVREVAPGPYIDGVRFLSDLDDSYVALRDPNVSNFFTGKWAPRGATVAELVENLASKGLRFAPATAADRPFYTALHRALVTYDVQLNQSVSR